MSVSSDEVNYLIWRYLQELGLETSAFSLFKESPNIDKFDRSFGEHVPIGSLVNLIQKGLLYTHVDRLLEKSPQRLSLFEALNIEKNINEPLEFKGRFQLRANEDYNKLNGDEHTRESTPEFIDVLTKTYTFQSSTCSNFNPKSPQVLAYGAKEGRARIVVLVESDTKEIVLSHPILEFDITAVSWSPLGHLVLTATENGELRLWTADGKLRNVLYLHHSSVIVIKWSPDSNHVLTTDVDNVTVIWNVQSGSMLQHFDLSKDSSGSNPGQPVSSFPAGTPITAPSSAISATPISTVATTNLPAAQQETLGIDAAWIDDSRVVVPGLNGTALVFNIGDRTPLGSLLGHRKSLSVLEYNPESSLLLTASDDRTIRVWNGSNFNNTIIFTGHSLPITSSSWIGNDFIISTSLDSSIRLWSLKDSNEEAYLELLDGIPIMIAKVSPDQKHIAVGTLESGFFVFKIDVTSQKKLRLVAEYQAEFTDKSMDIDGDTGSGLDPIADSVENYITSIDWNSASNRIVITYSLTDSVVVKIQV